MYTYDRDIILLPYAFKDERGLIKIPRGQASRDSLAANGLIGKISLSFDMTEEEIFDEIRCVFSSPMEQDPDFPVTFLQMSGGCSKTLTVPVVSSPYTGLKFNYPIQLYVEDWSRTYRVSLSFLLS